MAFLSHRWCVEGHYELTTVSNKLFINIFYGLLGIFYFYFFYIASIYRTPRQVVEDEFGLVSRKLSHSQEKKIKMVFLTN